MAERRNGSSRLSRLAFLLLLLPLTALACATLGRSAAPAAPLEKVAVATATPLSTGGQARVESEDVPLPETIPATPTVPTPSAGERAESDSPAADILETPTALADVTASLAEVLASAEPPERDDIELARLYEGWEGVLEAASLVEQPLPLGAIEEMNILNVDRNEPGVVEFELLGVSEHAYFWFETAPGSVRPSEAELTWAKEAFDQIYEQSVATFGPENNPGVDGDPRLHVVNASPPTLCDFALYGDVCGTIGLFVGADALPSDVDPASNGREMFVMNDSYFGSPTYLAVLAHEFRHLIEENHDRGDADWEVEGSAELAEELAGFPGSGVSRANLFLRNPDQQLNRWTDGDVIPHYGQAYLLNRYIYDRFGADFYRQFAASPKTGLRALDEVAEGNGLTITGEEIWLDWLVASAIHSGEQTPPEYLFRVPELATASMMKVDGLPASFAQHVNQFGADYFHLTGDGDVTLEFSGRETVSLIDTIPATGEYMWLANRANYGHMYLSRSVDLSDVPAATLSYNVYHDIEDGYDFAYVFVSVDEGQSWQPLTSEGMQGELPEDDPSASALAPRFYTGRSNAWRAESIDLTPYAGQHIQIRFAYVTDPIHTLGGIAIDDIAIPEIGFYDGAETPLEGWTAGGFERVTANIPQPWRLQLVTFEDGVPRVESILDEAAHSLSHRISLDESDGEAILIVAATAPMTLQPARYNLTFNR
jgi:immune inhibitor A